ncbi:2-oxoglutarate dehydrogenase E1 component [Haliangium ochraceum]|uniref:2-oxoglutarate dehydrogenase E1 component n=1 Tax=Haliangium ochraceum (strain DSM 14365 / JCM 11303 / SMP-2) TaxID=502025 RepID=D0LVC2_HALO1|nr:2-oxoglutarate dehydrogenase E1 component [Haliangium ochraceum]ACY17483.1 2-oxoglutarate dehydrogenase, E1 subunit [Haliangium ochraceum DSM 14365]
MSDTDRGGNDPLNSSSLTFAEDLYQTYLDDPQAVPADWRVYFDQLDGKGTGSGSGAGANGPSFPWRSLFHGGARAGNGATRAGAVAAEMPPSGDADLQHRVDMMIRNYRVRGHEVATINPLGGDVPEIPELATDYYGFRESDFELPLAPNTLPGCAHLRDVYNALRATYTRSIGAEYMHISNGDVRRWLSDRMERGRNRIELSRATQLSILTKLTDAEIFEEFIQKKFVGAKRFSLEGGESLIPLLDMAIEKAANSGVKEIVLGMAHRGRLNVLANIMGKNPRTIFREFEDKNPERHFGSGDVKYHLGYSAEWVSAENHALHMSLAFNPSHLEFVNPVVMGRVRAKQDRFGDTDRTCGLAILIHGDAAFIGEGVVQETLNMSELDGYAVGGTLHVIVNNQLGFTTGSDQSRSTVYASDIAKMLQSPIFHVNGEDPEAVAQTIELAMDFRAEFGRDVVIDMYCYRRHGHNEGDEPAFTQPLMYSEIRQRPTVRESYIEHLLKLGEITGDEATEIADARRAHLEDELSVARSEDFQPHYSAGEGIWQPYHGGADVRTDDVETGIHEDDARSLLQRLTEVPEEFHQHPKITRGLKQRRAMAEGEHPLDWSAAEALALASLLTTGTRVRMTGQDAERGTFSQRHAVLHDVNSDARFMPLAHLAPDQAPIEIHNSPLSEAGVLGFEYGYSLDTPDGLVLWEAQYGDFVNAAQVIIDQFISSAEDKWNRLSGLVMLLPHGFEGSGPEHSSARLERFLQLCAEDNIQVANPSTPSQYFHLLRRQVRRPARKPLVVMTPKSLLRHHKAQSPLSEFTDGRFERVLADELEPARVKHVLLCSGKVYYDLLAERDAEERKDVAIIRLEQLYPLAMEELERVLSPYAAGTPVYWVQEEPANMGAWWFLRVQWGSQVLGHPFSGISRRASASPATGSGTSHKLEQTALVRAAILGAESSLVTTTS